MKVVLDTNACAPASGAKVLVTGDKALLRVEHLQEPGQKRPI